MPETHSAPARPYGAIKAGSESPRIIFVTNVIPPYHKPVLDRLAQRYPGMRVLVSTPMESNRQWRLEWEDLDVVVQKTITLNGSWRHPKGFNEPLYIHLPVDTIAQLRRFRADVVISGEMGTRTLLAAFYRRFSRNVRLIVWAEIAESTEQGRGWLRHAIRKVLHHSVDAFLVTGESGARYLRSLGIQQAKIFKIAYTTDITRFSQSPLTRLPEHARRLLYVGQLIERKGLLLLLAVLSKWAAKHPDQVIEFVLAGTGPLRANLEAFAAPANLRLTLLGNVEYEKLPEVYAASGIFVLPSLADTWAVVVNEAMASGLPVLGSVYAQAVSELVEEGQSGWTFRPDVEAEIWSAVDRCLTATPEELDRMRHHARETAVRLTPDRVTDMVDAAIIACLRSADRVNEPVGRMTHS